MKKTDLGKSKTSKDALKSTDVRESSGSKAIKSDCYASCMNDAWDLKGESVCESVCRV